MTTTMIAESPTPQFVSKRRLTISQATDLDLISPNPYNFRTPEKDSDNEEDIYDSAYKHHEDFCVYRGVYTPQNGTYDHEITEETRSANGNYLVSVNGYVVKGFLGEGAFGVVYRVSKEVEVHNRRVQKDFALKEVLINMKKNANLFQQENNPVTDLFKEVDIMKKLQHKNLVHLKEIITDHTHRMYIVMEYVKMGHIMKINPLDKTRYISPISGTVMGEAVASKCFKQLCEGMTYLHSRGIAHRDLKMDNILIDEDGSLRIADFGVSKIFNEESFDEVEDTQGTTEFHSPEICDDTETVVYSAFKADVWAAGVCLWIFVFGKLPFSGRYGELIKKIKEANPTRPHRVSKELDEMLSLLLSKDPMIRPHFRECLSFDLISCHSGNSESFKSESKESADDYSGKMSTSSDLTGAAQLSHRSREKVKGWAERARWKASTRKKNFQEELAEAERASEKKMQHKMKDTFFGMEAEDVAPVDKQGPAAASTEEVKSRRTTQTSSSLNSSLKIGAPVDVVPAVSSSSGCMCM